MMVTAYIMKLIFRFNVYTSKKTIKKVFIFKTNIVTTIFLTVGGILKKTYNEKKIFLLNALMLE